MNVGEIMATEVQVCRDMDALAEAARLMEQHDCGWVPVTAEGSRRLVGVLTDRDICLAAYHRGKPLMELRVRDAMTSVVRTCMAEASLSEAECVMRRARVRRLPVVDEQGLLIGILSLADLAREAARERRLLHPPLSREEVATTLAAICEPPEAVSRARAVCD